jgi:hypothetical protein
MQRLHVDAGHCAAGFTYGEGGRLDQMDAITTAVSLVGARAELAQVELSMRMIRSNEQAKQGLVDLILQSVEATGAYGADGVVRSPAVGIRLLTTA